MNLFKGVAEFFTPVLTSSHFYEKGVLTPEEFVAAGDQLVFKAKTWQWASGDKSLQKSYLPPNKQFLITRNVPSLRRAHTYAMTEAQEETVEADSGDGGWLSTHTDEFKSSAVDAEVDDVADQKAKKATINDVSAGVASLSVDDQVADIDDIPDMDAFEGDNLVEEEDEGTLKPQQGMLRVEEPEENIVKTRTYDISITYDKFYRTPRVFLFGYDEHRQPLTNAQIMEDISHDHANKTVTVETHPHLGTPHLSIHPCRHASTMKNIIDRMAGDVKVKPEESKSSKKSDEHPAKQVVSVDQYLIIFLKFISSVIPTIEYDYTMET